MSVLDVVALQLAAKPGDVTGNVERLLAAMRTQCVGADLVITPELVTTGYDLAIIDQRGAELAEPLDGPTVTAVTEEAQRLGTTVVLGLLERDGDALYDTAVVVVPDGTVHPFRKTHLYPPERLRFAAGNSLLTIDTPAGRLGPLICFEHAFPELATTLALAGAQILVIPSAVPFGYEYLLTLRTRARAQDNQVFAVACNLTGGDYCGRSLIVDPRGEVLAEAGVAEEALRARIDLAAIARERDREPALRMRRAEMYRVDAVDVPGIVPAAQQ
ncbi:carbon-nitrogen hydrolase family protein [Micromonospora sp. NPDC005806]|uniref:carbon-nitrogen hydrolase family protein n=1 Tax=Micromonospora sp. NPDC005806 TaxID=3364234 RepID=UPI0036BDC33B